MGPAPKLRIILRFLILSALSAAVSSPAYAWPPTYGAEFTFTSPEIIAGGSGHTINSPQNEAARDRLAETIRARCLETRGCKVIEKTKDGVKAYRVEYKDGWWFQIALDPKVVEVQTKATTLEDLQRFETRIQQDLFDQAATVGLKPHATIGGGHFHMGLSSTFDDNPLLFRNFLVDMANHPEVANWFGNVPAGPSMDYLPSQQREAFARIIDEFDRGEIQGIEALAVRIRDEVYTHTPVFEDPARNQSINLNRVADRRFFPHLKTVEFRSPRPQPNARTYVRQIEMFEARLRHLRSITTPIAYKNPPASSPSRLASLMGAWVQESRLDPVTYGFPDPSLSAREPSCVTRAVSSLVRP